MLALARINDIHREPFAVAVLNKTDLSAALVATLDLTLMDSRIASVHLLLPLKTFAQKHLAQR